MLGEDLKVFFWFLKSLSKGARGWWNSQRKGLGLGAAAAVGAGVR